MRLGKTQKAIITELGNRGVQNYKELKSILKMEIKDSLIGLKNKNLVRTLYIGQVVNNKHKKVRYYQLTPKGMRYYLYPEQFKK